MKKNKMMRLASVLLVLVMLTTCVISGTFAKYVTADDATDSARVAKWGIVITTEDDENSKLVTDTKDDAVEAHISALKELKLLAPGTKGNIAKASIKGTPEVAFDVTVAVDLTLTGWTYDDDKDPATPDKEYCPLVFTVNSVDYKIDGSTIKTVAELEKAVEVAIIEALIDSSVYQSTTEKPGNYTSDTGTVYICQYAADATYYETAKEVQIDWSWAFEGDNVADTALGDLSTAPTLNFAFATQVTQVD